MNARIRLILLGTATCVGTASGQGVFHIGFEGPPVQPEGTSYFVREYREAGIVFTPIGGPAEYPFARQRAGSSLPWMGDSGSTYVSTSGPGSLSARFADGASFDVVSVDLAEYGTIVPDAVTVRFVGFRVDGSSVSQSFTTDGVVDGLGPLADFETFYFSEAFRGLTRLEVPPSGWCLDNLVLAVVPEPGTSTLVILGGSWLCWVATRRKAGQTR